MLPEKLKLKHSTTIAVLSITLLEVSKQKTIPS